MRLGSTLVTKGMELYLVMILFHTWSAPTLLREASILGEKACTKDRVVVLFRYSVAAFFPPVRMAVASEKERFFTALIKIGFA